MMMLRSILCGMAGTGLVASMAAATTIPAGIQGSLIGFYDGSAAYSDTSETTLTTTGGAVAALKNQAPGASGTDAVQATAAAQPTLVAGTNGQNAIRFNGSSDFLTSALSSTDLGANDGYTLFMVAKSNGTAGSNGGGAGLTSVLRFQSTAGSYVVYPYTYGGNANLLLQSGQNPITGGALSDGSYHEGTAIYRGVSQANGEQTYLDGVSQASATTTANPIATGQSLYIGEYLASSEFTNGDIEALLIYNTALSPSQQHSVDQFLLATYGVPEPASMAVVGLAGLLLGRRRRHGDTFGG